MTDKLTLERLNYLADKAQDGTGFLQLDTASALELIAAARAHVEWHAEALCTCPLHPRASVDQKIANEREEEGREWLDTQAENATLRAEVERLKSRSVVKTGVLVDELRAEVGLLKADSINMRDQSFEQIAALRAENERLSEIRENVGSANQRLQAENERLTESHATQVEAARSFELHLIASVKENERLREALMEIANLTDASPPEAPMPVQFEPMSAAIARAALQSKGE
jgi:hypothetical protein